MKIILPRALDRYTVILHDRENGEAVIELTESPGNTGRQGETLECLGERVGRIISFKEERTC